MAYSQARGGFLRPMARLTQARRAAGSGAVGGESRPKRRLPQAPPTGRGDVIAFPQEVADRQARALRLCREAGWGALVAFGRAFFDRPGALAYLTGFMPPFPSSAEVPPLRALGQAAVLLTPGHGPVVFADAMSGGAKDPSFELVATSDVAGRLAERLKALGLDRQEVGLAGRDLVPAAVLARLRCQAATVRFADADVALAALRRRKSAAEVEGLRRACAVAEAGLTAAVAALGVGRTERQVAAAGTAACLEAGADFVRYFRVHAGAASAGGSRWPPATDAAIADGDLVTLDVIGAAAGYAFDLLRTALVGRADPEAEALLADALAVERAAVAAIRPGQTVAGVLAAARAEAAARGQEAQLSAFAGHGIGIETLEPPYLAPDQEDAIDVGEVLCVEPSLRLPGRGGACREDAVHVGERGTEILSPFLDGPIRV
jgi:Xaa-Pro dipeptidase